MLLPDDSAQILDVGCGTGVYAIAFVAAGYDLTGIDAARGMLSRAKAKVSPEFKSRLVFGEENLDKQLRSRKRHLHGAMPAD